MKLANLNTWLHKSVRRNLLDRDLELVRAHLVGHVLEIGAGRHGRRGDFEIPATDSWTYVDLSTGALPHVLADVAQLPFTRQYFDALLCLEVFEYVDNPLEALLQLKQAVKIGGTLVLSVPFFHRADTSTDKWRFTESGLRFLFAQSGLQIILVTAQGAAYATMVNTLKYAISLREPNRQKWLVRLARPILDAVLAHDSKSAKKFPVLSTFSTGFLVLAKRNND